MLVMMYYNVVFHRHTKEARTVSPHPYSEVLRKPEQKDIDTISPRYTA